MSSASINVIKLPVELFMPVLRAIDTPEFFLLGGVVEKQFFMSFNDRGFFPMMNVFMKNKS